MADLPVLVVVESPAKAKTIAKYLGSGYVVRATGGHIVDLATKGTKYNLGIDLENNFKPKYKDIPDKKDKVKAILESAKQAKLILLASDKDREGEAIAFHIADKLKKTKQTIARITFDEITKSSLNKAVSELKELDQNLYDAQQARRVLDRIVGFMVSPYLMNILGEKLSAGRVQSVCLRLIVDRESEINAFVPEVYWNINASLAKINALKDKFVAKYTKRVTDDKTANTIKKELEESTFKVTNVDAKEAKKNPPAPLTTSKMQQLASARFKFSASRTMKAAQSLYESGNVTYIRSDSTRCSAESIAAARAWLKKSGYDLPSKQNSFKNKDSSQDAHEAIRPTDVSVTPDEFVGTDDEKKTYKLIWERFVASQMKPALFDTVAVSIKASKGHELKANGRTLKYSGWLAITQDVSSKKEELVKLPVLKPGDNLKLVSPKVKAEKKETQPPPRYTEGSLIKELDKRGIGRPSTYAAIIEKISSRNYVLKKKNTFLPTTLGVQVTDTLQKYFSFMKYDYTAEMERQLDKIANGNLDYAKMLGEFFEPFKKELRDARNSSYRDGGHDCDKCGKRMLLKHSRYGFFIACSGYPECKNTIGVELHGDDIVIRPKHEILDDIKCPKCNVGMVRRDGKFGPFYSCSRYPKCFGSRKIPFGKKCIKCGEEMYMTVFNGEPKLACMGYPKCRNVESLPKGADPKWIDPNKILPEKHKNIEKIIDK